MTAIFSPMVAGGSAARSGTADLRSAAFDLAKARVVVRDGLLMVFGPEEDPLPPSTLSALAGERPGQTIPYARGGTVPLDRLVAVLQAQTRSALAPAGDEDEARAWIEAMLGLRETTDEADATSLDAERQDDPPDTNELPTAFDRPDLAPDPPKSWSPERPEFEVEELGPDAVSDVTAGATLDWPAFDPDRWQHEREVGPGAGEGAVCERMSNASEDPPSPCDADIAATTRDGGDLDTESIPGASSVSEPAAVVQGALGLPDELYLGAQGVLGLGILGEAVVRVAGPILYVRIEGVPEGALLTAGRSEGDGSWSLTADDLARVSLVTSRPLADFELRILITSEDVGDLRDLVRVVTAPAEAADSPMATEGAGSVVTFSPPLSPRNDLGRFVLVRIDGVPAGASLSAGAPDHAGTWVLSPQDLRNLRLSVPSGHHDDVVLRAIAIAIDDRDGAFSTATQDLVVTPEQAGPQQRCSGSGRPFAEPTAGRAVPLDVRAHLDQLGGEDGLTALAVGGLAGMAALSNGTFDDETGSWVLRPNELDDTSLVPLAGRKLPVPLHVKLTAIRVAPGSDRPAARTCVVTVQADDPRGQADPTTRHARPGGVGFFRPIARRRATASA